MAEERALTVQTRQLKAIQTGLQGLLPALGQAIPSTMKRYLTPESLTKVAFLAIRKSPDLVKCTPESICQSVMEAATLGLEVGGPLGHAHLVPFQNRKKGIMECQLIIGYTGYINLARRSGEVSSVTAQVVYENDLFDIDLASGKPPTHKPLLKGDRGAPYLVYVVAYFKDGGFHPEMMTKSDIDAIRKKSKMSDGPAWRDNYWAMGLKSCIRKAKKMWPLSTNTAIEMSKAERIEDKVEDWGEAPIDVPFTEVLAEEPEPKSRTAEVLAQISNQDTGETTWEGGPEEHKPDAPPPQPANEELLSYVRTRWAELMPDARTDKDIMQALKGLGVDRPSLGKCTDQDLKTLLGTFDRKRPEAQA